MDSEIYSSLLSSTLFTALFVWIVRVGIVVYALYLVTRLFNAIIAYLDRH